MRESDVSGWPERNDELKGGVEPMTSDIVETYVEKALTIANDNRHGYSQVNRWGNPDYDCSSFVITCVQAAGIPVKDKGATYTGNMLSAFKRCGFTDVTSRVNLATGSGLVRGDILLNRTHHTEIYIGNGKNVGAHISETGGVTGKTGDQTGKEICTNNYYNFPWTNVLRYTAEATTAGKKDVEAIAREVIAGKWGNGNDRKQRLTAAGYNPEEVQDRVNTLINGGTNSNQLDTIAREVIAGKWGNGAARVQKLRRAGYNPTTVQKRVNEFLR